MSDRDGRGRASAQRRQIIVLVIVVALLRIAVALFVYHDAPERTVTDDSPSFRQPALALVESRAYLTEPDGRPEFFRTPGYPAFLAVGYEIGGRSWAVPLVVQAALSALAVGLTYGLARRLGLGHRAAMIAAVLVAFDPLQTLYAAQFMSEALATVLTVAMAYAAVRWSERCRSAGWAAIFGLLLAVGTMVRPTTTYFVPIAVALMAVLARRAASSWRDTVRVTAAFLAPAVLILGAWSVRNQAEVDSWRLASAEAALNYWYRAGAIVAERDGIPWETTARTRLTQELVPGLSMRQAAPYRFGTEPPPQWKGSVGDYYATADARARSIVFAHPWIAANEFVQGLYSQVRSTGWATTAAFFGIDPLPPPVDWAGRIAITSMALLGLAGATISLGRRRDRRRHVIPVALVTYVFVASAAASGIEGHRFRSPTWPIIVVYAVIGASAAWAVRPRASG